MKVTITLAKGNLLLHCASGRALYNSFCLSPILNPNPLFLELFVFLNFKKKKKKKKFINKKMDKF